MTRVQRDELVRLATLIDGEGVIGIYCSKSEAAKFGIWHFLVLFGQSQKSKFNTLEWMKSKQKIHGGYLSPDYSRDDQQPAYRLQWNGRAAVKILRSVLPYLELKREQAELFLRAFKEWPRWQGPKPLPHEIYLKREEWKALINSYNSKPARQNRAEPLMLAINAANDEEGVTTMHGTHE